MHELDEFIILVEDYPSIDIKDPASAYQLVMGMCRHFNQENAPDKWISWLSLNLAESGMMKEYKMEIIKGRTNR